MFYLISNNRALYLKTDLKTAFGRWEVPKQENLHFHFHAFSGWGASQGPILVLKAVF